MEQIVIDDAFVSSDLINSRGQKYPNIAISKDNIVKPSVATGHCSEDIFIENDTNFWKRSFHQFRYKGFCPMLSFVTQYGDDRKQDETWTIAMKCFYWFAFTFLSIRSLYLSIYFYFFPFDKLSDEELLETFNRNLDWRAGLIRAFEWHPSSLRCALALFNDLIYIYSADLARPFNHICCLKNMAQKRISSIAWHPKRDDLLAVASQNKILLWTLQSDMQSFKQDPLKCLQVIDAKLPSPLTSLVFDANGDCLVVCSPRSSALSIISFDWKMDSPSRSTVRLVMVPFSPQFTALYWSPDAKRLLAHTTSAQIRIFENTQWSSRCWKTNLSPLPQAAAWSSTGRILLFAPRNSSKIFALTFYDKAEAGDVGGGPDNSVMLLDTAEPHFADCELGHQIQDIQWDKKSTCLAIIFQDKPNVIALFGTHLTSALQFWPLCTIKSKFDGADRLSSLPLLIKFHDYHSEGGCRLLSVCWSNGIVSHISIPTLGEDVSRLSQTLNTNATPRSLTTLCANFGAQTTSITTTRNPDSANISLRNVASPIASSPDLFGSPSQFNRSKVGVTPSRTSICSPRRATLFSTRIKLD